MSNYSETPETDDLIPDGAIACALTTRRTVREGNVGHLRPSVEQHQTKAQQNEDTQGRKRLLEDGAPQPRYNARQVSSRRRILNQPIVLNFPERMERLPVACGGLSGYFLSEFRRRSIDLHSKGNPCASSFAMYALLVPENSEVSGSDCAICQCALQGSMKKMPCSHAFHENCLFEWLQVHNTCPCCRCEIESSCPLYNRLNKEKISGAVREEAMIPIEAVQHREGSDGQS
mmetsp:Transcript_13325/g.30674  ORF Transcript_13325/g.30674 Transcript_13325/m.30674 type:complete len:231 (-) Transcript_13325:1019-1711(-)